MSEDKIKKIIKLTKNDTQDDIYNDNSTYSDSDYESSNKKNISIKLPLKEAIITVEERSLYVKIDRYFKSCQIDQIEKMVSIINNTDNISLRMLNWFAMKYSATMSTLERLNEHGKTEFFDIKISYKGQLSTHSKKYFDPFRRGKKFDYCYDKNDTTKTVETTLCQLNFFQWLLTNKLIDYVVKHFELLKQKMGSFNSKEKERKIIKKDKEKKKTIELNGKTEMTRIKIKKFLEKPPDKIILSF